MTHAFPRLSRLVARSLGLALGALLLAAAAAPAAAQPVVPEDASVERLATGFQFTEGPHWTEDGTLLFSDIPANTVYEWMPEADSVAVFRRPSGHANGIAETPQGRYLLAQHDGRVSKITADGQAVVLADAYEGRRLNSPNDIDVKSNGNVYFTDPPYGVEDENRELEVNGVYRLDGSGELTLLADDFARPNGIAFSPDESVLYVNDTQRGHVRAFDVAADGTVENGRVFADGIGPDSTGAPDGMVVDRAGRVYTTGPGGFWIFDADGSLVRRVDVPERATNLAWGGPDHQTLFITCTDSIFRLRTNATGTTR
jgi:gluconolactonase